jgi:nucleotide-binding universal stress UspA family protein
MVTTSERRTTGPETGMEAIQSAGAGVVTAERQGWAGFSSILACIDGSPHAAGVLAWATTLARLLHASLRTLSVLDTWAGNAAPHDPIVWEMRRNEARNRIERLLERAGVDEDEIAGVEVAVGLFHECFRASLAGNAVDLCLIGATGEGARPERIIGDTARRVVEAAPCSVLLVPTQGLGDVGRGTVAVRRLMVPLDCSRRAEIALPAAIALADAFGAEIVMAHAVPEPAITEIGPPDETDVALRRNVADHNYRAAARYMSRLRARLALDRRPIRTLILSGSDPRHQLARAAAEEAADLIVLAAKGAGGYADQSLGSVADFLVTHLGKPLLIVRPGPGRKARTVASGLAPTDGDVPVRVRS